jgi:hypothetical protein
MTEAFHSCECVECNDRASRRFMPVHVNAHRSIQMTPRTEPLVRRAEAGSQLLTGRVDEAC